MCQFYPGPILQAPGIWVVAIEAAQQTTGHEDHDPHAGTVYGGSRFVRVYPAESRLLAFERLGLGRIR